MIGVFGGTFNPIHNAHVKLALEVKQLLQLDSVRMIPCGIPAHRTCPAISSEERFSLLQTAIAPYAGLVADDLELNRSGPSYMIDTLKILRTRYTDTLCLIIGADAFHRFDSWRNWREIFDMCHVVVMRRPEMTTSERCSAELEKFIQPRVATDLQVLRENSAGKIMFLLNTEYDISSTKLREKLSKGQSAANMLPEAVNKNIRVKELYNKPKQYVE